MPALEDGPTSELICSSIAESGTTLLRLKGDSRDVHFPGRLWGRALEVLGDTSKVPLKCNKKLCLCTQWLALGYSTFGNALRGAHSAALSLLKLGDLYPQVLTP
jgi:hypothetical protein